MNIQEALKLLNSKFIYRLDDGLDNWKIMKGPDKWHGDCEDYSLTLMWLLSNKSILRLLWNILIFKYIMWFVRLPSGENHAVVKIDGLFYDNVQKKGVTDTYMKRSGYKFLFPMIPPLIYFKMLLGVLFRR